MDLISSSNTIKVRRVPHKKHSMREQNGSWTSELVCDRDPVLHSLDEAKATDIYHRRALGTGVFFMTKLLVKDRSCAA